MRTGDVKDAEAADLFRSLPTLNTERLTLRPFTMNDAEDVFAYASDPEVPRYLPWEPHATIEDSRSFLEGVLSAYKEGRPFAWALVLKQAGKVVGGAGYNSWDRPNRSAAFGYAMAKQLWGQGLMTEATKAILGFGFDQMNLNRIWAIAEPENIGSWRVMEKCGLSYEGTMRELRFERGRFRTFKQYAILRSEWEAGLRTSPG
ncbi:MAG TPA: GNAT family protein [Actinomycetota bacterium]|nr:GNAT family protein [Actinomycetota bacterium]